MLRRGARVAVAALLAGCAAAPYTRRSQLILISPEEENKLGARAFQQVLGKSHLDARAQVNGAVEAVGQRLARVAERPDYKWRFVAIDDPKQQNAFCLPGGKVAVYTGIFPLAESTNGLAVVLGHEIAHALARHGAERMSQGLVAQAGGSLLGAWLGGGPGPNTILAAYGLGAQLGVLLPYSRTQESEADHIGLLLMARAGYDPRGALAFWQRMERAAGGAPPEFLSTHPSHGTREQQIQAWLPEAMRYYEASAHAGVEPLPAIAGAMARSTHRAPIALMNFSLAIGFEREYQLPFSFSPFQTMRWGEGLDAAVSRSTGRRWGGVVSSGGGRSRVSARVGELGDFSPACGARCAVDLREPDAGRGRRGVGDAGHHLGRSAAPAARRVARQGLRHVDRAPACGALVRRYARARGAERFCA